MTLNSPQCGSGWLVGGLVRWFGGVGNGGWFVTVARSASGSMSEGGELLDLAKPSEIAGLAQLLAWRALLELCSCGEVALNPDWPYVRLAPEWGATGATGDEPAAALAAASVMLVSLTAGLLNIDAVEGFPAADAR